MSFEGKVVIVTGASSGIGAAVAEAFSDEGARVVMVARNKTKLAVVGSRCRSPLILQADVSNDDDLRRIVDQTIEHFGQIDILINNAGMWCFGNVITGKIIQSYDSVMRVNLRGPVVLSSLASPHLIKTKGNIINLSSVAGMTTSDEKSGMIMYCVSKAALIHFSSCCAAEMAPYGVRVNTISPGPVETDLLENANSSVTWEYFKQQTALNRVADPKEIAEFVMYIASDKAKAITGSNQVIDNGLLLKCN